jgi:Leucine-rich repeat (LRR) protein
MDTKQVTVKLGSDTKQTKPTNTKKNNKTQPSVDLNKEFQRAKDENITRLNLSKNNITVVPPNIKDLANLIELYLYGNKIAVLPPEIGSLTQLQTLALNENQVGWMTNGKFQSVTKWKSCFSSRLCRNRSKIWQNWRFWICAITN